MVKIQAHLLGEGKLSRYQRNKYRQVQGKIFSQWEKYADVRGISASALLISCFLNCQSCMRPRYELDRCSRVGFSEKQHCFSLLNVTRRSR